MSGWLNGAGSATGSTRPRGSATRRLLPGEEPETSDLTEGVQPPIGVMEGGLAVHWDAKTGVITANPIKE